MRPRQVFGLSVVLSLLSSGLAAWLLAWPRLETMEVATALVWLVTPHMFLRFIGLSFLLPGVVSPSLSREWANPAAYGDLAAGVLAIVATTALAAGAAWAMTAVWVFNIVGAGDLLFAFYKGVGVRLDPGALGAAYYVVTPIVPLLLTTHALIFILLIRA